MEKCCVRLRRWSDWKVRPATASTTWVLSTADTWMAHRLSASSGHDTVSPTPNGTKKSAMAPSRNFAAGRTVSALTQRMQSAAKSRIMPMMLPDT